MAEQTALLPAFDPPQKATRKSYTVDEKLRVVDFYNKNGKNLYRTSRHIGMNTKNVLRWLKDEKKNRECKGGSR